MSRFWGRRLADDVEDELVFHRDMRIAEYLSRGMSDAEARERAAARLGDLGAPREACLTIGHRKARRMRRTLMFDMLRQDLAFAVRTLSRQPVWTAIAVLTLALGVAATTSVYSVVNTLLLHAIPYPEPDRVRLVMSEWGKASGAMMSPNRTNLLLWQREARGIEALEMYEYRDRTMYRPGVDPAIVSTGSMQATFLDFVGARVVAGRTLTPEDAAAGAPPVALLGESAWRQRFGGDRAVLGQLLTLDDTAYEIVGVVSDIPLLPRRNVRPEIWLPLNPLAEGVIPLAMLRLAPGVTTAAAERELDALQARNPQRSPDLVTRVLLPDELTGFSPTLRLLGLAVLLVLLIACANVAHLLLARGAVRERELAIRASLGAGRLRIFRQLLTESLLLTTGAAVLGLVLGRAALQLMIRWRPETLDELAQVRFDTGVVVAALLLALVTGTVFGVMGMLQLRRKATQASLRSGALASSATRGQRRLRGALLVTEMALSATLLVATSMLVRSILHLQATDPGFRAEGLYTASFAFPASQSPQAREQFLATLRERSVRLPGVAQATIAESAPPVIGMMFASPEAEGETPPSERGAVLYNGVGADYFATLGLPLVQGTTFTDTTAASTQLIVNEGMAKTRWPDGQAVGKRMRLTATSPWLTIVGVAGDITGHGLAADRSQPMVYVPRTPSEGGAGGTLVLRGRGEANPVAPLRALAREIDPRLPPAEVKSVAFAMERSIARQQFVTRLLLAFAGLALLLAAIGLYGVMAYTVAQRTRDIGIRMALGASARQVLQSVLGGGLTLAALGIGAGLLGSLWASRLLKGLLYGVREGDPLSFLVGALVLAAAAMIAALVPARRALRVAPVVAMRTE